MKFTRKLVFGIFFLGLSLSNASALTPTLPPSGIVGTTVQGGGDTLTITFDSPVSPVDGTWSLNEFDYIKSPTSTPLVLSNAQFSTNTGATTTLTITLNKATDASYLINGNTILVKVASSTIQNDFGEFVENTDVESDTTITGDTSAPHTCGTTFSSSNSSSTFAKIGDVITVSFCATEKVRTPSILIGGRTTTSTNTGGNNWNGMVITNASDTEGVMPFSIDFMDLAGNLGGQIFSTSNSSYVTFDKTSPRATTTISDTSIGIGETATTTFTFSEPVINFDNSDLTVLNGTLTSVTSTDGGTTWTAVFTPTNGIVSTGTIITLNMVTLTDRAGNTGTSTVTSNTYYVDTVRPTLTITSSDLDLASPAEQALITFLFSEKVLGFSTTSIIRVDNGTLTIPTSTDSGITWTATFVPSGATIVNNNVIIVNMSGVTDLTGNTGTGTTSSPFYNVNTVIVGFSGGGGGGGGTTNYYPPSSSYVGAPTGQVLGSSITGFTFTKDTFKRDLDLASQGDDVKELQKVLLLEGLLKVEPTGYFGITTKQALIKWQEKNGIPRTGYFGMLTRKTLLKKINTFPPTPITSSSTKKYFTSTTTKQLARDLDIGSKGVDVTELQKKLILEGFLKGDPSGYFGNLTKEALSKWQEKHGLPTTGYYGMMTKAMWKKVYVQ